MRRLKPPLRTLSPEGCGSSHAPRGTPGAGPRQGPGPPSPLLVALVAVVAAVAAATSAALFTAVIAAALVAAAAIATAIATAALPPCAACALAPPPRARRPRRALSPSLSWAAPLFLLMPALGAAASAAAPHFL